jgi:hypothetical protein
VKIPHQKFSSNLIILISQRTKDPTTRRLVRKKIEFYNKTSRSLDYHFLAPEHGMELVRTRAFAFHVEEATAYKIIRETFDEKLICKLSEIVVNKPHHMVGGLQKNSPFRELFTYGWVTSHLTSRWVLFNWKFPQNSSIEGNRDNGSMAANFSLAKAKMRSEFADVRFHRRHDRNLFLADSTVCRLHAQLRGFNCGNMDFSRREQRAKTCSQATTSTAGKIKARSSSSSNDGVSRVTRSKA